YMLEVLEINKREIICKILSKHEDVYSSKTIIHAAIGMLKNDNMNLVIQKLTEIGVTKIIPFYSKRCIIKLEQKNNNDSKKENKREKWELISRETLKQCQGVKLVEINEPVSLDEVLYINKKEHEKNIVNKKEEENSEYDLKIVLYEGAKENSLKNILKSFRENNEVQNKIRLKKVLFIVGPEGGFDKEEIEGLEKNEVQVATLGKRILRAETASIVVGGILANEFE
ncbi:MAG: RsmE family RNA methyltransferase, partial [Fusobacteriaceae bacterium]